MSQYFLPMLLGLLIGTGAGFVMHRSDYCIAGMFRDLFMFRRTTMLRSLVLLITASMILFESARHLDLLIRYPFPLLGAPSLTNLFGGFLFGIGMVLAGGCVVGTLYKMGSGSVISLVAFTGLLAGSGLYAEIHPWWIILGKKTSLGTKAKTLPQLFQLDPLVLMILFAVPGTMLCLYWFKKGRMIRSSQTTGYIQPWKTALVLALLGTVSYICMGMPLGITTAYAKMAAYIEAVFLPEHVSSLAYFKAVPLNYRIPLTGQTVSGGAGPVFDAISIVQFPIILGIAGGSCLSALLLGEFTVRFSLPPRQLVSAFCGGILMALASRMAPACNIWHLLGGLPILALQSLLFLTGLLPGAWLGTRIFVKLVMNLQKTDHTVLCNFPGTARLK